MNNRENTYKSLRTFIEANKVISFNSVKTKKEIFSQIENLLLSNTSFNKNELAKYLLKLENKNIYFDNQIFPVKNFFSSRLKNYSNNPAVSSVSIKTFVKIL